MAHLDNYDLIRHRRPALEHTHTVTDPREASVAPARGSIGRFEVLGTLGSGGMGTVYAAHDPQLDRKVALKLLHDRRSDGSRQTKADARLLREAQAIAKVSHPNVIHVYEVGVVTIQERERIFLAMELVEGLNLREWMVRLHANEGWQRRGAWAEVVEHLIQAGQGLAAAHAAGVLHRDFKPDNILVGDDGLVRVVDFGLARWVEETGVERTKTAASHPSALDDSLSTTGALVGTPAYMAAEQLRGQMTDARTDQFAFCLTLYEALLGVRPYDYGAAQGLAACVKAGELRPWPKRPRIPGHLVRILRKGLSVDPDDRFESMEAVIGALGKDPRRRRRMRLAWGGVGAVAITATSATWALVAPGEPLCAAAAEVIESHWGDHDRAAVRTQFEASSLPYANTMLKHVEHRLDTYAAGWIEARTATCEATRVHGDQSEQLLDLRVACLDRHVRDLGILVDRFASADDALVEHASKVLDGLEQPTRCANTQVSAGAPALPDDPTQRDEAESIRVALFQARTTWVTGRYAAALKAAQAAIVRARALGHGPTTAHAMLSVGRYQYAVGDRAPALISLHEAAQMGTAAAADLLVARAWLNIAWFSSTSKDAGAGEALRYVGYARAMLDRMGGHWLLEAEIHSCESTIWQDAGDNQRALDAHIAALAVYQREGETPQFADALRHGNILMGLGRYADAREVMTRSLEAIKQSLGAYHPLVAMQHNALGILAFRTGDLAEAERHLATSVEITEALPGPTDPELVFVLGNLGEIRRLQGHYDTALAAHKRVLSFVEQTYPPDHPDVGRTKHNIATTLRERGDPEISLRWYAEALIVRAAAHGPDHNFVANTLTGQGLALLQLGRMDDAVAALDRAHAIREARAADDRQRADTAFGLARALDAASTTPDRALSLANDARRRLASLADDTIAAAQLVEVDAWLSARATPGG